MKHFLLCLAVLSAGIAQPLHAATYCVDANLNLATSLAAAAASSEDDIIRIRTGSYSGIGAIDLNVRGALSISGGWGLSCLVRSESATTTISGASAQNFKLTLDGYDLLLLGLTFSGWNQVILSDVAQQFGPTDEIRVSRSRFTNATTHGLLIDAGSHNIVVENSRFDAYGGTGLYIFRTLDSLDGASVLLQHNTISSPANLTASGLRVSAVNSAPVANIRIYNTVIDGNASDLRLFGQSALVRNSHWTTQLFTAPAGLSFGSGLNLSGNPGLDANFRPIEPSSQLINTGVVLAGSSPSTDYDGGPRVFGIRPDLGAYESTVPGTTVINVTTTADTGAGSLRAAITTANSSGGDAIIEFNIVGACPRVINLASPLPTIAKSVRIEGYTQPGSEQNTDRAFFTGSVCVFLRGGGSVTGGLNLVTDAATDDIYVSGLGFDGFTNNAIVVAGPGKAQIRGSLFGTGLPSQGFDDSAIRIEGASGSVIGGDGVEDRNVIANAAQVGIRIDGAGARTVRNNLIGSNRSGGGAPNGIGIRVADGDGDVIRNNNISYSTAEGILLADGSNAPQNVEILSNSIGASAVNSAVGGNGGNAIRVAGGSGHVIRSNSIFNNQSDGIAVLANSRRVWIASNRFANNQLLPIDLSPNGRNFIDLDVGQTGANDRQNFPSLFTSGGQHLSGSTRVQLSSANGTYVAQVFASERCTGFSIGHDDAAQLVGTSDPLTLTCATAVSNCTASIVVPLRTSDSYPLVGKFLSAVVWDEERNTSEFSVCQPYELSDLIFRDGFQ